MDSGHCCNALTHFLSRLLQDMTREQIGEEKVALQKGLLYYESIHGRPVSTPPQLLSPCLLINILAPLAECFLTSV